MIKHSRILILTVLLVLLMVGCSGKSTNPIVPSGTGTDVPNPNDTESIIEEPGEEIISQSNLSDLPLRDMEEIKSNRYILGTWQVTLDVDSLTATVTPVRNADQHYDVTQYVIPVGVIINSYDHATDVADVNVTIKNPIQYHKNVYDVRLIIITDDTGHSNSMRNPDNWTELHDKPGGLTSNPFKAYNKDLPERPFHTGSESTENVLVYCPGNDYVVDFVVDASYPTNCDEPYEIKNFQQEELLSDVGSTAWIQVDVYDWQDDVNEVKLRCPDIIVEETALFTDRVGDNTWKLNLENSTGAPAGEYGAMIFATSENSGALEMIHRVKITVTDDENDPPVIEITNCPTEPITENIYTFEWTMTDDNTPVEYLIVEINKDESAEWVELDNGALSYEWTGITEGSHTFKVRVTDDGTPPLTSEDVVCPYEREDGNGQPEVDITNCPTEPLTVNFYTFEWTMSDDSTPEEELIVEIKLDDGPWIEQPDAGIMSYLWEDISIGSHTFKVRVTDNGDPALTSEPPDSCTFEILPNGQPVVEITNCPTEPLTENIYIFNWTMSDDNTSEGDLKVEIKKDNDPWIDHPDGNGSTSYTWSGISYGSHTFCVKVTDDASPALSGEDCCDFEREEPRTITVTSPNSGDVWEAGDSEVISWTTTGDIGYVKISYYHGDTFGGWITLNYTPNDGFHPWLNIPEAAVGTNIRIKVEWTGSPNVYDYSDYFTIEESRSITVTRPTSGDVWEAGDSELINWSWTGDIDYVKISYYHGSTFGGWIISSTLNDGSYSWNNIPDAAVGTNVRIKVEWTEDSNVYDYSDYFTIEEPRSITVTSPNSGDIWKAGENELIEWDWTGDMNYVKITYYHGSSFGGWIISSTPNDGSHWWNDIPDAAVGTNVRIKVEWTEDSNVYDYSDYLTIEDSLPWCLVKLTCWEAILDKWHDTPELDILEFACGVRECTNPSRFGTTTNWAGFGPVECNDSVLTGSVNCVTYSPDPEMNDGDITAMYGPIYVAWVQDYLYDGWEMGFAKEDQKPVYGVGDWQKFEGGHITSSSCGAFPVRGAIHTYWIDHGGMAGTSFGPACSGEYPYGGGNNVRQDFKYYSICHNPDTQWTGPCGDPGEGLQIKTQNLDLLNSFGEECYNGNRLLWTCGQELYVPEPEWNYEREHNSYTQHAQNTQFWGQCVSTAAALSWTTISWSLCEPGDPVNAGTTTAGTVIYTPEYIGGIRHMAIFKKYVAGGIEMWDANWYTVNGQGVVGKHTIYYSGSGFSDADNYCILMYDQ